MCLQPIPSLIIIGILGDALYLENDNYSSFVKTFDTELQFLLQNLKIEILIQASINLVCIINPILCHIA